MVSGSLDDEFGFGGDAANGHPKARTVDFSDTMLLFTTNAAAAVYDRPDFATCSRDAPSQAMAQLRAALAPAPVAAGGDGDGAARQQLLGSS